MINKINLITATKKVQIIQNNEILLSINGDTDITLDHRNTWDILLLNDDINTLFPNGLTIDHRLIESTGINGSYTTFNGNRNDLVELLSSEFFYGGGSSVYWGSGTNTFLGEFVNYTDLQTQSPAGTPGRFAYVLNSEGTSWLPWSLGGTYRGAGWYYDTGSLWSNKNDEIFKGLDDLDKEIDDMAFIKVDEGSGVGYILKGLDRTPFNPIGYGTLDLSEGDAIPRGTIGEGGFVNGYNLLGDGYAQLLLGWDNIGNGNYCLVNGISNDTSGGGCVVVGAALSNQGGDVMAIFGQANTLPAGNPYHLQVGNGTISGTGSRVLNAVVRSDAFRVYKNGAIEAPSITDALIISIGPKSLVSKEYVDKIFRKVQGDLTRVGQTTIPLMNQQNNVFENYIQLSLTPTVSDNFLISLAYLWSMDVGSENFIARLKVDDGVTTEIIDFIQEPKDTGGSGILIDTLAGGIIGAQIDTGTDIRVPEQFSFNKDLVAGTTYTISLDWAGTAINSEATIYQAQIWVEQKTII